MAGIIETCIKAGCSSGVKLIKAILVG